MRTSARRSGIEDHVFFLDKCLGSEDVRNALAAMGARIEILLDHFDHDTPDTEWIPDVGKRGWIIFLKDRHIRSNALEVRALIQSGTAAFLLTSANMNGKSMAASFVSAMPTVLRFLQKFDRPFIASVTAIGSVNYIHNYADMVRRLS